MPPETIADVSRRVAEKGDATASVELGRVVLLKSRYGPVRRRILRFFGVNPDLTVRLDQLGSAVWQLIDGVRTVEEIRRELSKQFPDQTDLGARLGKFLGFMVSRDLVLLR